MLRSLLLSALVVLPLGALVDSAVPPAVAGSEWLPVPPQSLAVARGSSLDFSDLVAGSPAGVHGALNLKGGALRFEDGSTPRFNCGIVENGPNGTWDWPTHEEADAFAEQLRRHGYNLVRFHFADARLMRGASHDLQIDPKALERFYYQLAALKRAGIYWMLDMLTTPNGGPSHTRWATSGGDSLKARVIFDAEAQARWLAQVDAIYARPNPYTGISPLADPALAFVVGANENSLAFAAREGIPADLALPFDRWLRNRFPDSKTRATTLGDLRADQPASSPVRLPSGWDATGPSATLFREFVAELELTSYRRMTSDLANRGYHGPLLAYPEWYRSQSNATRGRLPITDIHAYVGEVVSYAPGTPMKLPSSTSDEGLNAWTANSGARWLDRPLVASEYGFPIPNPYRYEGALFPAIAAMQGYSAICKMAQSPIEPAILATKIGKPMLGYSVGIDPVSRATETLSTLLFYRGDMAPLAGTLGVLFGEGEFAHPGSGYLPGGLRRASLLVRFGLTPPDKADSVPTPRMIIPTTPSAFDVAKRTLGKLSDMITGETVAQSTATVAALRGAGLLPVSNATNPARGRYQSRDGELDIDQRAGTIRIATPRTQAFSSTSAVDFATVGDLEVRSLNTGALVAAAALDGRPLRSSERILIVMTADAVNSSLNLAGSGTSRTLIDWGKLPILLRHVTVDLAIHHDSSHRSRLEPLSLAGQPIGLAPVTMDPNGTLRVKLDTGMVHGQPTTYFLLSIGESKTIQTGRFH